MENPGGGSPPRTFSYRACCPYLPLGLVLISSPVVPIYVALNEPAIRLEPAFILMALLSVGLAFGGRYLILRLINESIQLWPDRLELISWTGARHSVPLAEITAIRKVSTYRSGFRKYEVEAKGASFVISSEMNDFDDLLLFLEGTPAAEQQRALAARNDNSDWGLTASKERSTQTEIPRNPSP